MNGVLRYRVICGGPGKTISNTTSEKTFSVEGLQACTIYTVTVIAFNGAGKSDESTTMGETRSEGEGCLGNILTV